MLMPKLWSDGRYREGEPQLYAAIRKYWDDRNEDEMLRLKWENEWLREGLSLPPEPWEQIKADKEALKQLRKEAGTGT